MNDDWRVQVTCQTSDTAERLGHALRKGGLEHNMQDTAGDRVVVSVDDNELFLYSGMRPQAEQAAEAVKALVAQSSETVRTELRRWHPVAEEWVDADVPLPATEAQRAAEHAEEIEQDREDTAELHYDEWEVRIETGSHRETLALAETLRGEGVPCLRRWRYLLIGAADEDVANTIAERVRAIAPADSRIRVETSARLVESDMPPNPFAVFGGLGG